MTETKLGEQSIRRAARQAAVAAQARRRAKAAERDKRLDAAALTLIVTLKERDALERRAGAAIRAMLTDGLTLADVLTWTDGETTLKEATRLSELGVSQWPACCCSSTKSPKPSCGDTLSEPVGGG